MKTTADGKHHNPIFNESFFRLTDRLLIKNLKEGIKKENNKMSSKMTKTLPTWVLPTEDIFSTSSQNKSQQCNIMSPINSACLWLGRGRQSTQRQLHREMMQTPHRDAPGNQGSNSGPFYCEATVLTTIPLQSYSGCCNVNIANHWTWVTLKHCNTKIH